ncbi:hypothetical protein [Fundicoccus ignavus]|uniref:Uncharacterized protein n=1 Tax=Fundicoccus ignavus TaxID=2664442 RepID=A0A844CCB0_9LACT|nr:hypothetical protein [Fundicoccus ignavus]MRJ48513.1 hypothetical protein [Fundicoccus ignavus]
MSEYSEISLLIIGGLISLVSTTTFYIIQQLMNWALVNRGKVKIYKKIVYSKINGASWGFHKDGSDIVFSVPLWLEIQNTKNKKEILRNLNIYLYKNNKKICQMKQIHHYRDAKESELKAFGDNGSYSFLMEPNTISRYDLYFILRREELNIDFNEIRLGYYNTKDKFIELFFLEVEKPWIVKKNSIDNDWSQLKRKNIRSK